MDQDSAAGTLTSLVRAIEKGDPAAEAELYERFGARVLYFARGELRSTDLAEDARSETFMRALQTIRQGGLRAPESLASFVLQTARHVVYEIIRSRMRAHAGLDPDQLDSYAALEPVELPDPDVVDSVRETLHDLSARDRAFLKMYYYDERPKAEIARTLGIDEARVRLIKSRALQRFRIAYERRGGRG